MVDLGFKNKYTDTENILKSSNWKQIIMMYFKNQSLVCEAQILFVYEKSFRKK